MVYPKTALCWIIFTLGFTVINSQAKVEQIEVEEMNDNLSLKCPYTSCEWKYEGESMNAIDSKSCLLSLGSVWNDPRGTYSCHGTEGDSGKVTFIDVYVRKCHNCIELDAGTISGFIIADLIMIGFIAAAVYFVSGSETRRPGRASDKQNLIEGDQAYQELGPRRNDEYSMPVMRTRNAI